MKQIKKQLVKGNRHDIVDLFQLFLVSQMVQNKNDGCVQEKNLSKETFLAGITFYF